MKCILLPMLLLFGCGPSAVSLGEARHVQVLALAEPADPSAVMLLLRDGEECLQLPSPAHAEFDGQPLQLVDPGGPIELHDYSLTCLDAQFSGLLPAASSSGSAHAFTIEDDQGQVTLELPHYLLQPTLTLSSTTLHVGDRVTVTWSPSDLALCGGEDAGACGAYLSQTTSFGDTRYIVLTPTIEGNTLAFTVPSTVDVDAGSAQLNVRMSTGFPGTLDGPFSYGVPSTPISRCVGAESCIATPPYDPAPVDVVLEPADGGT